MLQWLPNEIQWEVIKDLDAQGGYGLLHIPAFHQFLTLMIDFNVTENISKAGFDAPGQGLNGCSNILKIADVNECELLHGSSDVIVTSSGLVILSLNQVSKLDFANYEFKERLHILISSDITDFQPRLPESFSHDQQNASIGICTFIKDLRAHGLLRLVGNILSTLVFDTTSIFIPKEFYIKNLKWMLFIGCETLDVEPRYKFESEELEIISFKEVPPCLIYEGVEFERLPFLKTLSISSLPGNRVNLTKLQLKSLKNLDISNIGKIEKLNLPNLTDLWISELYDSGRPFVIKDLYLPAIQSFRLVNENSTHEIVVDDIRVGDCLKEVTLRSAHTLCDSEACDYSFLGKTTYLLIRSVDYKLQDLELDRLLELDIELTTNNFRSRVSPPILHLKTLRITIPEGHCTELPFIGAISLNLLELFIENPRFILGDKLRLLGSAIKEIHLQNSGPSQKYCEWDGKVDLFQGLTSLIIDGFEVDTLETPSSLKRLNVRNSKSLPLLTCNDNITKLFIKGRKVDSCTTSTLTITQEYPSLNNLCIKQFDKVVITTDLSNLLHLVISPLRCIVSGRMRNLKTFGYVPYDRYSDEIECEDILEISDDVSRYTLDPNFPIEPF